MLHDLYNQQASMQDWWLKAYLVEADEAVGGDARIAVCINSETQFLDMHRVFDTDIFATESGAPIPKWFTFLWTNLKPEMLNLGFTMRKGHGGWIIRWRDLEEREVRDMYELAHEPGDEINRGMLPLGRK